MEQQNPFNKDTLLVILLCVGIWFMWQKHLQTKYAQNTAETDSTTQSVSSSAKDTSSTETNKDAQVKATDMEQPLPLSNTGPEKTWVFNDSLRSVTVSSKGGRISEVRLKNFFDRDNKSIQLIRASQPGFLTLSGAHGALAWAANANYQLDQLANNTVQLSAHEHGIVVTKKFEFIPETYQTKVEIKVSGVLKDVNEIPLEWGLPLPSANNAISAGGSWFMRSVGENVQDFYIVHGSKSDRKTLSPKDKPKLDYDQAFLASVGSRYFAAFGVNRSDVIPHASGMRDSNDTFMRLSYPVLPGNDSVTIHLDFYSGPKSLPLLKRVDPEAKGIVDFGMFSWIAIPLLKLMKGLYAVFKNYGVAIVLLTLIVRLLTFPFTYASYRSMKAMQRIQPEIQRLRQVYKADPGRMNQEVMKLMKENKANPMGGCLPMLLQLPIFWALYRVLENSIELYRAPFMFWIHDLSLKDPYFVLPILMGITMVVQQKMTPTTMDPAQARIMLVMPILFSFLMFGLPSGLNLYIFVSSLFGIIQQAIISKDRTLNAQVISSAGSKKEGVKSW